MLVIAQSALGSGLLGSIARVAVILGTLLLVMGVVALAAFAYRSLSGDGVEWPDEEPDESDDGVSRGDSDDEYKYY